MSKPNKGIWTETSWIGLFTDPYISGIGELERGHFSSSMNALGYLLKQTKNDARWTNQELKAFDCLGKMLKEAIPLAYVPDQLKSGEDYGKFVSMLTKRIADMKQGEMMMIPGGWNGSDTVGCVIHLIERCTGSSEYSFVTCNAGGNPGLEYHPSRSHHEGDEVKLKYKTCLRMNKIPVERMCDVAWWSVLMAQWMRAGQSAGENQRAEVLYDVLLPFLGGYGECDNGKTKKNEDGATTTTSSNSSSLAAILSSVQEESDTKKKTKGGTLLSLMDTMMDPCSDWRTSCRSGTDWWRSVWEASRYVLRRQGLDKIKLKQISASLRRVSMGLATRDMNAMTSTQTNPVSYPVLSSYADSPKRILSNLGSLEKASDASSSIALSSLTSLESVALLFGRSTCPHCKPAIAALKKWYNQLNQSGRRLEIVFVGMDADPNATNEMRSDMPWLSLPSKVDSDVVSELTTSIGLRGVPALVFFTPNLERVYSWNGLEDALKRDPQGTIFPRYCDLEDEDKMKEEEDGDGCSCCGDDHYLTITESDVHVLRMSCEQMGRCALKEHESKRSDDAELAAEEKRLHKLLSFVNSKRKDTMSLPPRIHPPEERLKMSKFDRTELLSNRESVDPFAGRSNPRTSSQPANLLASLESLKNITAAAKELEQCTQSVRTLLNRANDASASSRLALQYQVIHLIGHLFTQVLPMPQASTLTTAMSFLDNNVDDVSSSKTEEEHVKDVPKDDDKMDIDEEEDKEDSDRKAAERMAKKAQKEKEAQEKRQPLALQLMQFLPQHDLETCLGALEICEDSMSIAGNWLIAHSGTAKDDIKVELQRRRDEAKARELEKQEKASSTAAPAVIPTNVADRARAMESEDARTGGNLSASAGAKYRRELSNDKVACIWAESIPVELQTRLLRMIHNLSLTFAAMWQAVDHPTRAFDAERSVVALCMLALFDAVLRMPAKDKPLHVSVLLGMEGGYALSTTVCQANRLVEDVSATMELHSPQLHRARGAALEYLSAMRRSCSKTLFHLRMPMKIEIKKYSSTCIFLKRLLARCGYPLFPRSRGPRAAPPEIEALCKWLFDDTTPLAQRNPAFAMMRDMVCVHKFLSTMVTREQELMARRRQRDRAMWMEFSFSFEEGGRRRNWNITGGGARLEWEVVGFRGAPEKDTADVDVVGFQGRHLFFGEGPVVQSPADPKLLLNLSHDASEDDILHADTLPLFDDTLSREESELLLSYLTVPYARIPLVLNFFASKDRVTYLFNSDLQSLLRAVVFEAGVFVPEREREPIRRVPERRTHRQVLREERRRFDDARLGANKVYLGTSTGLLINELRHSPAATLRPLLFLCQATKELAQKSSVYSPDTEFTMFILQLAIDVEVFVADALNSKDIPKSQRKMLISHANQLRDFLEITARSLLIRWCKEAGEHNDIPTACVMHSYLALIWQSAPLETLRDKDGAVACMGSAMFVRNWHGFGMGTQRSDANAMGDPADRLLRFLQAHGVDTEKRRIDKSSLRRWTRGNGKPLYLRIGREVVRAPTFGSPWSANKDKNGPLLLPPADVPEAALFGMLQSQRHRLISCFEVAENLDDRLNRTMATALRNPKFQYAGWKLRNTSRRGGYTASDVEIQVDLQSAEVMWRSDELRPVPDSMAQFNDFDALFGRTPMHCGLVKRQQHRHWIHLVGKSMDLVEWDAPPKDGTEMGVNAPRVVKKPVSNFWACAACTYQNAGGDACQVCGTPRTRPGGQQRGGGQQGQQQGQKKKAPPDPVIFENVRYDRILDPYSKKPHDVEDERWAVDTLCSIVRYVYPPPMKKIPFALQLSSVKGKADDLELKLMGLADKDNEKVTWKEFVVTRDSKSTSESDILLNVYNLTSHGRRVYRSLVYSSNVRRALHSLPIDEKAASMSSAPPAVALRAAGDIGTAEGSKASLVVLRQFDSRKSPPLPPTKDFKDTSLTTSRETYVPSRLLQGVVPGALLEVYRFWQAEDGCLRGDPLDAESEWFHQPVMVTLQNSKQEGACVWRFIGDMSHDEDMNTAGTSVSLLRQRSSNDEDAMDVDESFVTESKVLQLLPLGCSIPAARLALSRNRGDVARSATWIFQAANAAIIAEAESKFTSASSKMELDEDGATASSSSSAATNNVVVKQSTNPKDWLVLISPTSRRLEPSLRRLIQALTRLEHMSHILLWAKLEDTKDETTSLSLIEIPRLRLRLVPRRGHDNILRLHVLDQEDWWLDRLDDEKDDSLWPCGKTFLRGLPHSLFLRSSRGERHLIVPNHDVCRPRIQGAPFSTSLRFDRSSATWQEVMSQRYYSYPIHTSRAFLMQPTLASLLYLILMRMLNRDYVSAFSLLDLCTVDVAFNAEERWVFDRLVQRTASDGHPDAVACRLKLVLAVRLMQQQASTTMGKDVWVREIHHECDRYLDVIDHVSAACRLTPQEEIHALKLCRSATPRVRNRLSLRASSSESKDVKSDICGAVPRVGGRPWMKLMSLDPSYVMSRCRKRVQYVQFKPPYDVKSSSPVVDEKAMFELLWKDEILVDEEGGANRQLGMLFLYELFRGKARVKFANQDCTSSFVHIMTRLFQLKNCRWGREQASGEGEEQDTDPSRELMQLVAVSMHPERGWPALPSDARSLSMLERGIELGATSQLRAQRGFRGFGYREQHREQNMVSLFIQFLETEFKQCLDSEIHVNCIGKARSVVRQCLKTSAILRGHVRSQIALGSEWSQYPAQVQDCSQHVREIVEDKEKEMISTELNDSNLLAMASRPLNSIASTMDGFVLFAGGKGDVEAAEREAKMPFDVSTHPAASPPIARDMLSRLETQVKSFARTRVGTSRPQLRDLTPSFIASLYDNSCSKRDSIRETALKSLERLLCELKDLAHEDAAHAARVARLVLEICTETRHDTSIESTKYRLRCVSRQYAPITLDFLTGALMSGNAESRLQNLNPFLSKSQIQSVLRAVSAMILRVSRVKHSQRTASMCLKVRSVVSKTASATKRGTVAYLNTLASGLANTLSSERHFMTRGTPFRFDPRFLVFEYVFGILLRERQVEIVRSFYNDVTGGKSRVQQMIMGAGKTTVVGPLLTLLLADGKRLITQVMPTALLQQTRTVLRNRFSTKILPKSVFTLIFERSVPDDVDIVSLIQEKMQLCLETRSVMCAAPEAIKSLFLKFIEQLHALDQMNFRANLLPGQSSRGSQIATDMAERMGRKSDMADAIVPVLSIWRKGVLVMDEVDVLLHPLRSELNFPIGPKYPIDLSGFRWDLPIHIIDGVLAADCGYLTEPIDSSTEEEADFAIPPVLKPLHEALDQGRVRHALQRSPHLVLLDPSFYHRHLKMHVARWVLVWLRHNFIGNVSVDDETMLKYLCHGSEDEKVRDNARPRISKGLSSESQKLLNLAADWTQTLLPHVLGKINRVTFGVLTPADLEASPPNMPLSRKLMAVPFTGKDVPSRASEFAHPDVLIGLTVLASRYSGIRKNDLRRVVVQLKHDFSRQSGPRHARPAAALFASWLKQAPGPRSERFFEEQKEQEVTTIDTKTPSLKISKTRAMPVLPLALFQPADPVQMDRLWNLLRWSPQVGHHWLRNHVFPKTMNFQRLKVSACGHALGGEILFGSRVGFSGTPSNLLPVALGTCQFEPDSDGRILHVLTSPQVVTVTLKKDWTAKSLLRDIATQTPRVHALIDSGAIITGLDNHEVATFLLKHLPSEMLGVVFLDRDDRKMVLQRQGGRLTPLDRCGLRPEQRFTFYDHVHTTGMDIKQSPNARAVQTIGKDMTFRDLAQGAYRMRGIGKGQTIELYLIPEVANRIQDDLKMIENRKSENPLLDVPAWLLLNAMRMEGLQFMQLSMQELQDVWRSRALESLVSEVVTNASSSTSSSKRMRRFETAYVVEDTKKMDVEGDDDPVETLRRSIEKFREKVGFAIPDGVPRPIRLRDTVNDSISENTAFVRTAADKSRVDHVKARLERASSALYSNGSGEARGNARLKATVVHENEKQQEEEAQKQVQQQRIKISAFCRDDEEPHPWPVDMLRQGVHSSSISSSRGSKNDVVFYELSKFRTRDDVPYLAFPGKIMVSDNWFRRSWIGLGARRLKPVTLVLEWTSSGVRTDLSSKNSTTEKDFAAQLRELHVEYVKKGMDATTAAVTALQKLQQNHKRARSDEGDGEEKGEESPKRRRTESRCVAVLCLSEGETIRRALHDNAENQRSLLDDSAVALRTLSGSILDSSDTFENYTISTSEDTVVDVPTSVNPTWLQNRMQCLRFLNSEMYYTGKQIRTLAESLKRSSPSDRLTFFEECLRLRQRERNLWSDTPIARIFTAEEEWSTLQARSVCNRLSSTLEAIAQNGGTISNTTLVRVFASPDQKAAHEQKLSMGIAEEKEDNSTAKSKRSVHTWTPSDWSIGKCIFERFGRTLVSSSRDENKFDDNDDDGTFSAKKEMGLGVAELHRVSLTLGLHFTVPDCVALVRFLGDGNEKTQISAKQFEIAIPSASKRAHLPASCATGQAIVDRLDSWICSNCTCQNLISNDLCVVCGRDWTGQRRVPPGQWECLAVEGGCTKYNSNRHFYCEVCAKAKPGLSSQRF